MLITSGTREIVYLLGAVSISVNANVYSVSILVLIGSVQRQAGDMSIPLLGKMVKKGKRFSM